MTRAYYNPDRKQTSLHKTLIEVLKEMQFFFSID
jgi:hypothetical protein